MQNRYVADFGDYVKLSILRALMGEPQRVRLGVAWWLFPDERHNGDGNHREYLQRPEQWKRFDPDLFESLATIDKEKKRDVRALEHAALLPDASRFFHHQWEQGASRPSGENSGALGKQHLELLSNSN
jgi:hypothetical protein